jgi:dolichol-phosphate mannosyltransferase
VRPDRVTVVVPTYNERDNLPHLAAAVLIHGYRLLVVDDNSPDGSGAIADELAATTQGMEVIHRQEKNGLGPAYAEGFSHALERHADVIVQMDCDFSHSPADIPRLVAAIDDGADVAVGSRYVRGGDTPDWPKRRRFLSRGGNLYARVMLRLPTRDATAGFKAWRADSLRTLPFAEAEASGYGFQVEMAMWSFDRKMRVVEVPIVFRDRLRGQSKMGSGIVLEAMRLVTVWGLDRRTAWLPWRK